MAIKLSELAKRINCDLQGEDCLIDNVADINQAEKGHLAFVYNPKYLDCIKSSNASAVIIKQAWLESCDKPALISDNPRLAFAKAATFAKCGQRCCSGCGRFCCNCGRCSHS